MEPEKRVGGSSLALMGLEIVVTLGIGTVVRLNTEIN
jgi:hypothetical protein